MRDYVRRLLAPWYEVVAVGNGEEALRVARTWTPDLVLTDVMMPGLDGFGLLNALRTDPNTAGLPVILLSARAGEEAKIEGLNAGADDYLVKPFSSVELVARIRSQLMLTNLRRERAEARREVERQKQDFVALCMQAPNPFVILRGPDYVIELANPAACRAWGRTPAEVLDRPMFEALPELRDQIFKELLDEVMRSGQPYEGKEVVARFAGSGEWNARNGVSQFRLFAVAQRARRHGRDPRHCVRRDGRNRARDQMNQLRAEAESANRSKDEFLAMLGHELRNPISPMQTALQLMRLRGTFSREQEILERQVGHLRAARGRSARRVTYYQRKD
jgi:CheY-like chemotaxis protein